MKISIDKAKQNKLFYVVTTGVIYHPKLKKCLILQRSKTEIAHPGIWGVFRRECLNGLLCLGAGLTTSCLPKVSITYIIPK